MADVAKKKFLIETTINPFQETRSKKAPAWFDARPGLKKSVTGIEIKRSLELDPRKWKTKDIVDGVHAVARYELALFATQLNDVEKSILKALPKEEQKKKTFVKGAKEEAKEKKALDDAESEVEKLYKRISKAIDKKVSLALDEVESDKGDNKKALAAGKEALKKFDKLDLNAMFDAPFDVAKKCLDDLAAKLKDGGDKKAWEAAKAGIADAEKQLAATAKVAQNVIKYLIDAGSKMASDTKANPALQKVGHSIAGAKSVMTNLSSAIDAFEDDLVRLRKLVKAQKAEADEVSGAAAEFSRKHSGKNTEADVAVKKVQAISKEFNAALREIRK